MLYLQIMYKCSKLVYIRQCLKFIINRRTPDMSKATQPIKAGQYTRLIDGQDIRRPILEGNFTIVKKATKRKAGFDPDELVFEGSRHRSSTYKYIYSPEWPALLPNDRKSYIPVQFQL